MNTFKQGVTNLSPALPCLVKKSNITGCDLISIKACDIEFKRSILNLRVVKGHMSDAYGPIQRWELQ